MLVGIALLWHAVSLLSGQQLMRTQASHSQALETVRHFIERLRVDGEWPTLYSHLSTLQGTPAPAEGHAPTQYFADFEVPEALGTVGILVEVPRAAAVGGAPGDPLVLREDMTATRFALPYDLSGDGVVDSAAHDGDYVSLPVIVHFNWQAPGEPVQTLRVSTWLRGPR